MYLGIDDTDSRNGMCTTYAGLIAILKIMDMGYDIIGYPRLVRLNPNIPWKTRGNGSVVLKIGHGSGERMKIGEHNGEAIHSYFRERKSKFNPELLDEVANEIEPLFVLNDETTNPGIVLSNKLPERIYWQGVREVLSLKEIEELLNENGAIYRKYKLGRGIIGASAGIAWRARKKTYELLAYTDNDDRFVDKESVIEMDRRIKSTFDNYDYENDYVAIMPSSRTPVLFGVRGLNPYDLLKAKSILKSSSYQSYLIYETNQGTDDHLVRRKINKIQRYESVIVRGIVHEKPRRIEGGHVVFTIADPTGKIPCAAYEPTKRFRNIVCKLLPGDEVEVYGGVRSAPLTINIEKIRIIKSPPRRVKVSNPVCPMCHRKMESIGRGKGYRCRKCGYKLPEDAAEFKIEKRDLEGSYEVPVIARRHLSMPLKIMGNVF